jgi:5-methylcytosine-specific restriction enzyme A
LVGDGSGYCRPHRQVARQQQDERRGTAAERGYDSRWRKVRAGFLRSHPLCARCEQDGVTTAATVVDHIVAHRGDRAKFWDHDNWQALCKHCHDRKTATEDGGWGRVKSLAD